MKPQRDSMQEALRRYINYLLSRGSEARAIGVIMLDANEKNVNHHLLEALNLETRCSFFSLAELPCEEKRTTPGVLVLDAHQSLPEVVSARFEGVFRASSFEGDVR